MQNKLARIFCLIVVFVASASVSQAQDNPEMADVMRSNGKIYVVVGCALIILAGLFIYVWSVDRKITKAEKNFRQ